MPLRSDWSDKPCPIARGLDVLGDAWTLVVLRELFSGNTRFEGLRTKLGAADKVLAARLSRIVDLGLAERVPYGGSVRPRAEYRLTESGQETLPVLHALALWGAKHTDAPEDTRPMVIACTRCGQPTASADWCITCGQPLTVASTQWTSPGNDGPPVRLGDVA
ncbi:winged helix-turn-helix transcriptional regulator [Mycolicibacterium smegmatis]|jgi:DNA-binding HxlR family transcriptional regulator|uniref:Transcriptional regulatory protein n=1 Tax=Mycolicibacterium smegmatis (strain MKD8) TaxID=1214915 RepID=A0A2U9PRN3_MYCSE|nr:helix-turn-helix domain-containing protein [Mycolicibacterium smegmatis]AWT54394.1 transcriptional regulatory protein [Mycolicibacterium smegmatis MKD8]ULN38244.1 helix-turn-helix transcriptional regulator [Mycolicibacterium smegmatis]